MTLQGIYEPIITTFINALNIFTLPSSRIMKRIKEKLVMAFDIVDVGPLAFDVRLKVTRNCEQKTIKLSQFSNIEKLFYGHGMLKAKTVKIFM